LHGCFIVLVLAVHFYTLLCVGLLVQLGLCGATCK